MPARLSLSDHEPKPAGVSTPEARQSEVKAMRHDETQIADGGTVTIRRLSEAEGDRVKVLAQLDGRHELEGPWLGAEVEGRVLAATSLTTGETVSDPFSRTAELRAMLELRAAQIHRRSNGSGRNGHRGFSLRANGNSRAALPNSPPGSGGRLLTLLPRF
jgi:hypothetical protein